MVHKELLLKKLCLRSALPLFVPANQPPWDGPFNLSESNTLRWMKKGLGGVRSQKSEESKLQILLSCKASSRPELKNQPDTFHIMASLRLSRNCLDVQTTCQIDYWLRNHSLWAKRQLNANKKNWILYLIRLQKLSQFLTDINNNHVYEQVWTSFH